MKSPATSRPLANSLVCLLMGALAGLATPTWGQAPVAKKAAPVTEALKPDVRVLQTKDGFNISVTYFPSRHGKESPVVVLLNGKDGNRFVWHNGLAERLQGLDYAVVTVDLRGHGESRAPGAPAAAPTTGGTTKSSSKKSSSTDFKPDVYQAMVIGDLEAVKKMLYEEHQAGKLNMTKTAIVGAETLSSVAVYYAAFDWNKAPHPDGPIGNRTPRGQDIRAIVLLSPENAPGMVLSKPLAELREPAYNVAFLVANCDKDSKDKGETAKLFKQITTLPGSKDRMYLQTYSGGLRGTQMIGRNLDIEKHMIVFFEKHLKPLQIPWRDRQSQLDKGT